VASNQLNWSKHKDKLADPIKTLSEAINTELLSAFSKVINTDANEDNPMAGSLAWTKSTLTVSTGAVTVTRSYHVIAAESGTADDLDTLTFAGSTDTLLIIQPDTGDTITVRHNTGSSPKILLRDDTNFAMVAADGDKLDLVYNGTDWEERGRTSTQPRVVQVITDADAAVATGSATTPLDDTIPQLTGEGNLYLSAAITPLKTDNILVILVNALVASNTAGVVATVALHQDTTEDALVATGELLSSVNILQTISLNHRMAAGTISETTFKVKIGPSSAATLSLNGQSAGRIYGGVAGSSLTIIEIDT